MLKNIKNTKNTKKSLSNKEKYVDNTPPSTYATSYDSVFKSRSKGLKSSLLAKDTSSDKESVHAKLRKKPPKSASSTSSSTTSPFTPLSSAESWGSPITSPVPRPSWGWTASSRLKTPHNHSWKTQNVYIPETLRVKPKTHLAHRI